jgi:hypothetical protein
MVTQILGVCRSGKFITSDGNIIGLKSPEDLFDAMAVYETLALRALRKRTTHPGYSTIESYADTLRRTLEDLGLMEPLMRAAGIRSSLDIPRYAQRLLRAEFRSLR